MKSAVIVGVELWAGAGGCEYSGVGRTWRYIWVVNEQENRGERVVKL